MTLDRRWLPLLYVLLAVESAYVLTEFAFNAAILNVASGAVSSTRWDFHNIEQFGRVLSGVGLGLLLYGYLLTRGELPSVGRRIKLAILIFPPAIAGMVYFQSWLAYEAIPNKATQEERFAAAYVQHLGPALRTGLVQIEDVPLTPDTLNRPESKAFLTLVTPVLMHNPSVVNKVVNSTEDLFKYMMQRQALESLDASWEAYTQTFDKLDLDSLYAQYEEASLIHRMKLERTLREIPNSQKRKNLGFALSYQWGRYLKKRQNPSRYPELPPLGLSPRGFLAHPDTLRAIDIYDSAILDAARPHHFRIVRQSQRGGIQVDATGFAKLIAKIKADEQFSERWTQEIYDETGLYLGYPLKPGLSKTAFFGSEWLQALIREKAPLPSYDRPLVPGLTQTQLLNQYLIPASWDNVQGQLSLLPRSPEAVELRHATDEALRAIYVPAIALAFSLFFSLVTLGKVVVRIWMIIGCHASVPPAGYRTVKLGLRIGALALILALPNLVATNSLAKSNILEAAAGNHLSPALTAALRWTLDVEPMIFPAGNALLPFVKIQGLDGYHDGKAAEADTTGGNRTIEALEVMMPLSVEALQRTLAAKGFDPGPIDGIIGTGTTNALKAFQKAHDLKPTGTQNYNTIQALRDR